MPRRLLDRFQADCIREFRLAARQRFDDALALAVAGQRTGAVYLWGYTAEMTLKAAYLSLIGIAESVPITPRDHFRPAYEQARVMRIAWEDAGRWHNVRAWADLLIATRASRGVAYSPSFGRGVQLRGQRIWQLWRETLRYHKNYAYLYEVRQVHEAAEWFLGHSRQL